MKSRMDKYYKDDDDLQRTTRNTDLYEKLYKDKQEPDPNMTVLDNFDEIDIEKIKNMVNDREGYRTAKKYEDWTNKNRESENIKKPNSYEIDGIDDSKYDINQIIENKRQCRTSEECDKLRKLSETQPIILTDIDSCVIEDDSMAKELMDTLTSLGNSTDFFSNLKEDPEETKELESTTTVVKEESFYTDTVSFDNEDFDDSCETSNGISVFLKVIIILSFLIAIGVFVYFKFIA